MNEESKSPRCYWDIISNIPSEEEYFLERWAMRMGQAGYLQHTTAKRVDCVMALKDFLAPMRAHWEQRIFSPDFPWLLRHEGHWGALQIESARRHRVRGITADLYIGCFKTFLDSLIDVVERMEGSYESKVQARRHIKVYGDALEVLFIQDWTRTLPDLAAQKLDEANRLLTLEKCRYENIYNSTSDLIFVVDAAGVVVRANDAVLVVFGTDDFVGMSVTKVLSLGVGSFESFLQNHPVGTFFEVQPFDEKTTYRMQVNSIGNVSMASNEFIVLLSNITTQTSQRQALEQVVSERTEALRKEKEQLEEMNITLRNVLQSIDRERDQILNEIGDKLKNLVFPALERIKEEDDAVVRKGYITVITDQLARLAPGSSSTDPLLLKLTPTEMRVCQSIQAGLSSKDIANNMNLSLETVQTHRKNIRNKLGLKGKSVSLYAHLKTSGMFA